MVNWLYIRCIFATLFVKFVAADYCDFGFCEKGLYCCGENKCCKTVDVWYYWAAVLLIVISVVVVIYFFVRQRRKDYMYTEVRQTEES